MKDERTGEQLLESIGSRFDLDPRIAEDGTAWVSVGEQRLRDCLAFAKREGFDHCSAISVTDWPEDGTFELTYHLWSYGHKLLLTVTSRIDRRKATVDSVIPLWGPSAGIHERELHELFGVEFSGHPDPAPLFLEDWRGPPPFRKNFDWRDYVRRELYDEANPREHGYWD